MRGYTVELAKVNSQHSIVLWVRPSGRKEFVVCSYYDENKPVGSQWSWGHYFNDLWSAVQYCKEHGLRDKALYFCELPATEQAALLVKLIDKGITGDDLERAVCSKVADLEELLGGDDDEDVQLLHSESDKPRGGRFDIVFASGE